MDMDDGRKFTCCGDEPLNASATHYAKGSEWLLHEAFCLYSQADIFDPYEKHHSTVKDACELAERLGVKNLLYTIQRIGIFLTEKGFIQRKAQNIIAVTFGFRMIWIS